MSSSSSSINWNTNFNLNQYSATRSPLHLLYLVALSAIVIFSYDAVLQPFSPETHVLSPELARELDTRMSRMGKKRRRELEKRVMAVTQSSWPECVSNHMTSYECKFFIDDMIKRLFTEKDLLIKTKIVGKRALHDDWYNTIVIQMGDNDLTLGRDADGMVYYDFPWVGSGEAATPEQEAEIPPIIGTETITGALEGQEVGADPTYDYAAAVVNAGTAGTTTNAPPLDPPPPPPPPPPAPTPPAPTPPASFDDYVPDVVTDDAPTDDGTDDLIVTTDATLTTTTGATPTTATEATQSEQSTVAASGVESGAGAAVDPLGNTINTSTAATAAAASSTTGYTAPPVDVIEEPALVEGGQIDDVLAQTETNPINGGILLAEDALFANTEEGAVKLEAELAEVPPLEPPGVRTLGPFDCSGLTGFSCCLIIKNAVRDVDESGNAIQCFLEYAEGTAKLKHMQNMGGKKVMIHSNHNGFVSKEPRIQGNGEAKKYNELNGNGNGKNKL